MVSCVYLLQIKEIKRDMRYEIDNKTNENTTTTFLQKQVICNNNCISNIQRKNTTNAPFAQNGHLNRLANCCFFSVMLIYRIVDNIQTS